MNELNTIHEIFRDSKLETVLLTSSIFIIWLIITKVFDYIRSKNRNKPLIEMSKAIKEMGTNISIINATLSKFIEDSTKKDADKCKQAIESSFAVFNFRLFSFCRTTIIYNNIINNKEIIISNVNQTVNFEYYKLLSNLSLYEINNKLVSSHLKDEWIKELSNELIFIIYNNQEPINRISSIYNRLSALIQDYSTFVYNKTFNN